MGPLGKPSPDPGLKSVPTRVNAHVRKQYRCSRLGLRLLILLVIVPSLAWTASGAELKGVVRDQNGDIVAGASVEANKLANGWNITVATDTSGSYEVKGLSPGEYRLSASRAGFSTAARSIRILANDIIQQDFLLLPGVIEDSVTVTAGKGSGRVVAETPQTIAVRSSAEIERQRPLSPTQLLEGLPNLTTIGANPLAARLRLRGLTSNRVLVIVDGERLNNVRTDPASGISPAIVDVTQLESAEVLSGSGSSLYGSDALAGTISLITKEPVLSSDRRPYLGLRFDVDARSNGELGRGSATFNFSTSRLAVRAGGTLFRLNDYRSGGQPIPLSEVVRIGNFATLMSNAVGTGIARSFAVWELPEGGEIPNGQARGFYSKIDVWLFATPSQSVRYSQVSNQHKDLGFAFLSPPYDVRLQSNGFRRLDKYGARYEGHELRSWMPRLAVSFYRQKYSFSDDNLSHSIAVGSSWQQSEDQTIPVLTGNASTFTPSNFTAGKSSVTSYGAEAQATLNLFKGARLTTGLGYLSDSSADSFSRVDFPSIADGTRTDFTGRASTPDSSYRNLSWSSLFEYDLLERLRLNVSLRVDNWLTHAKVTPGFPLGTESNILNASFDSLSSTPGGIDVEGARGILSLVNGRNDIRSKRTSMTGGAGVVFRLPGSVNTYFRWEASYREPGITERYLLRNFGDRTFSLLVVPNTTLKPERGNVYEIGLKVQRTRWRATLNYFRNYLRNFIGNEFSPALFVPPDPANGLDPISPDFPFHGVLYVQRANTARSRIQGIESNFEASLPLNNLGSITPFGSVGWLKGTNQTPDQQTLTLLRSFYNRKDTPLTLKGSAEDAPMSSISPFGGLFGVRFSDGHGGWMGEYDIRYRARVTRVDPADLTTALTTQYGSFASLRSSLVQSVRAGYTFRRENYRVMLATGVDNLTGRLYFEPFQLAPAPGRSYVFGLTLDGFGLLRR